MTSPTDVTDSQVVQYILLSYATSGGRAASPTGTEADALWTYAQRSRAGRPLGRQRAATGAG